MPRLGPCAYCGRPAKGQVHLVIYNLVRRSWAVCDAHAACCAIEPLVLEVRCMDHTHRAQAS